MYECKYGCGYGHKQRGTMNLHESKHCKLKDASKTTSNTTSNTTSDCDCSEGGSWRMMTSQEKQIALSQHPNSDYKEVCDECQELR
jgi:hypothetical protein